jgi:hypothetical protein
MSATPNQRQQAIATVLSLAAKEIGVSESKNSAGQHNNSGKRVREYQASTGHAGSFWPWCAAFVTFIIKAAAKALGINILFDGTASCDVILAFARAHGILKNTPQAGDVFLIMASDRDATHTGFVLKVWQKDGATWFSTIEGNSNDEGSREGYEVASNERRLKNNQKFVRWAALVPATTVTANNADGTTAEVEQPKPYKLTHNGALVAEMPVRGADALVPVRALGVATGEFVHWDADDRIMYIGGKKILAEIIFVDGKGYAPVRKAAECIGYTIQADAATREAKLIKAA